MNLTQLPSHIFGMHDSGAEHLFTDAGKRAWIVQSVLATASPGNFSGLAQQGHGMIVRLNHGYFPKGTLPFSLQYDAFAAACGNYAAGSQGVRIWVIGNETNLKGEHPGADDDAREELITPARYAQCFKKCRAAIKGAPGHADDWVIPSPPGPWNVETAYAGNERGDWVDYFRDVLNECVRVGAPPDALALHTYSHEALMDAGLVDGEQPFTNAAYPNRHSQFRTYRDFMGAVPAALRTLPVFITESQHLPWDNRNVGWVQRAFAEINAWNAVATNQPIQALCLFRWTANPRDPVQAGWSVSDRERLQDDLRAALQNDFRVRWTAAAGKASPATKPPATTPMPFVLPVDKIRWFTEEAIRKLEAEDGAGARAILSGTVSPWFYASYPQNATDLVRAQAHTDARWHSEEATRQIEAGNLTGARQILVDPVLAWLTSKGPSALGILSFEVGTTTSKATTKPKRGAKKTSKRKRAPGVLSVETPTGTSGAEGSAGPVSFDVTGASPSAQLLAEGEAHQLLQFNREAALQKRIFADGLVPNSAEFTVTMDNVAYVAQRAEHLLTGKVRVYYAPTANVADVHFATREGGATLNTPFKGGNRITQLFAARPAYYQQFHLAGHEGVDMVPLDGKREMYCIEDGVIVRDVDIPGDPKTNAYGIYVAVFNAANRRMWYYCHMKENLVTGKQEVKRGDLLGHMGGTGNVQGDHLHLNVKLLDASSLPLTPNNGFKGWSDPLPLLNVLNTAVVSTPLSEALLAKADASQSVAFNTQAALQKQMFAEGFFPNSAEFNVVLDGKNHVAQRAENLNTGAVRVYYAPTSNFADVKFVER